ncbi:MAG: GDP-mannose 4,6-dehydratase [Candidatus Bathyarchaeota archaeon]|nr:GDP-mannose 4,6-dehydratase [Candidatus Bathyarchaeota archaeon]
MVQSFWQNKRVLVTGANGFVGSWLCQRLVSEDAQVVVLIRDHIPGSNFNKLGLHARVDEVSGTLTDFDLVWRTVSEYTVEYCFHLAAQAIVGVANQSPLSTFESNIRGTWNLLEALRLSKNVQGAVVASSDKSYGIHRDLPYREEHALNPLYPYDTSKACVDLLSRCYFHTFGLPVAVTRFVNIYGGGDLNFSRIIPDSVRAVLRGHNPVIRSDGTPERDFIFVDDVVDLYLEIARRLPDEEVAGEVFNGGHNQPVKILDLVEKIIELSGRHDLRPDIRGKDAGHAEIDRQWLDATKARKVLGWEPKVGLEEGLSKTIEWYRDHLG